MAYTMEDFRRDYALKLISAMTTRERVEALMGLPPKERRQIVKGILESLPKEAVARVLRRRKKGATAGKRKTRKGRFQSRSPHQEEQP